MARARVLLAVVLAASALVVLAGPAPASVPSANPKKFCKAINTIQQKLEDAGTNASNVNTDTLKKFAAGIKASGKQAPEKVKKAANSLASFYSGLASRNPAAITKASRIGDAFATYFTYVSTHCS